MIQTTVPEVNLLKIFPFLTRFLDKKRGGYSFGKGQRPGIASEEGGLGPGQYNYNPKERSKLGKFGS
jgi:hypothetical protein